MIGFIRCSEVAGFFPRQPILCKRRICGMTFLEAEIFLPKNRTRKRAAARAIQRGAKKLRNARVNRYVKPSGPFLWEELLMSYGLFSVTQSRLFTAMAVPLTLRILEEEGQPPHSSIVALCGERTGPLLEQIALSLCQKVRNLAINAVGSENLCRRLRQEYGVPVLEGGAGMTQSAVTLLFSPLLPGREAGTGSGPVLYFGSAPPGIASNRRLVQSAAFTLREGEPLPEDWDRSALLSVLYEQGRIGLSEIEIEQLS